MLPADKGSLVRRNSLSGPSTATGRRGSSSTADTKAGESVVKGTFQCVVVDTVQETKEEDENIFFASILEHPQKARIGEITKNMEEAGVVVPFLDIRLSTVSSDVRHRRASALAHLIEGLKGYRSVGDLKNKKFEIVPCLDSMEDVEKILSSYVDEYGAITEKQGFILQNTQIGSSVHEFIRGHPSPAVKSSIQIQLESMFKNTRATKEIVLNYIEDNQIRLGRLTIELFDLFLSLCEHSPTHMVHALSKMWFKTQIWDYRAILKAVQKSGKDFSIIEEGWHFSALEFAAIYGHSELLKVIIAAGTIKLNPRYYERFAKEGEPDHSEMYKSTSRALYLAVKLHHYEAVKVLIFGGAWVDVLELDRAGQTDFESLAHDYLQHMSNLSRDDAALQIRIFVKKVQLIIAWANQLNPQAAPKGFRSALVVINKSQRTKFKVTDNGLEQAFQRVPDGPAKQQILKEQNATQEESALDFLQQFLPNFSGGLQTGQWVASTHLQR